MTVTTEYVHKSEKIAEIGKGAGWATKIIPEMTEPDITWVIYFSRKPEVMRVTYVGNRLTEAIYKVGDKTTNPPHKAAVVKILLGQPDLTRLDGASVMQHRKLPFNPTDDQASDILAILLGKRITWLNSFSTELDTELIERHRNKGSQWYRIVRTQDGRRYVEFTCNTGFRAVYLDAIVSAI